MKIKYAQNPLHTTVHLDEQDKKEFLYKVKIVQLREMVHDAAWIFQNTANENYKACTVEDGIKSVTTSNRSLWGPGGDYPDSAFEKRCLEILSYDVKALAELSHDGDCVSQPASCCRCGAEERLEINTLEGMPYHVGALLYCLPPEYTADDIIAYLEKYDARSWTSGTYAEERNASSKKGAEWMRKYKKEHLL